MSFFAENSDGLARLSIPTKGNRKYRDCQVGAAWATLAHFTSSRDPALISMPTGSGKTALMMMLALLLKPKHVVIVNPSIVLRDQTAEKFASLKDLKDAGVYPKDGAVPLVHNHDTGRVTSVDQWREFLEYDVIVATPHTISPGYEDVVAPPDDVFGKDTLFFFDEAHHSRAPTWQVLLESFEKSRRVLLTATPFRNDRRRLLAKLIYHYPMRLALDAGIYEPITYHSVETDNPKNKDEQLCKKARLIYRKHQKKYPDARLLIRAELVRHSGRLLNLYRDAGLNVEEVNYERRLKENEEALNKLRKGSLDGIICIDKIGEGLDIPHLKVAVLHKPRQSFPATVQFVGRICRPAKRTGPPQLIACPDDVKGSLQRLYKHDHSWNDFVPKLVERIIGRVSRREAFHESAYIEGTLDLEPEDIEPFFSVRIYRIRDGALIDLDSQIDLPDEIAPVMIERTQDGMFLLVTGIDKEFPWANKTQLTTLWYDLHVLYEPYGSDLLFEYTTSDKIAAIVRKKLLTGSIQRLSPADIAKALQEAQSCQYLMFGMANVSQQSGAIPAYKTYMGNQVEGAVRPTDGRSFTPGHALARFADGMTRGIGSFQSRVWSIKRSSLDEFKDWCDTVAMSLGRKSDSRLPNVEFLASPEVIEEFPARPLALFCNWDPNLEVSVGIGRSKIKVGAISFDKPQISKDKKSIEGKLFMLRENGTEEVIPYQYTLTIPRWIWGVEFILPLRIDDGTGYQKFSLERFLDEFPPLIILDNGNTVLGGNLFVLPRELSALPGECFDAGRDWNGCDIYIETDYDHPADPSKSRHSRKGHFSVHDQIEQRLKREANRSTFIIKDHASGEIADFINVNQSKSSISFYHCKACSPGKSPGSRIEELKGLEQAFRSIHYVRNNSLLLELNKRVKNNARRETKLVKGSAANLEKLAATFRPYEWQFEVVIVNPGIDCAKIVKSRNTNILLTTCYEWISNAGATLKVIGS